VVRRIVAGKKKEDQSDVPREMRRGDRSDVPGGKRTGKGSVKRIAEEKEIEIETEMVADVIETRLLVRLPPVWMNPVTSLAHRTG
jgi:hypothetical protein